MVRKILHANVAIFAMSLFVAALFTFQCKAEVIYQNPKTNYQAVIEDDAHLFAEEDVLVFQDEMKALTEYGNVCVKTIQVNDMWSATDYANAFYDKRFGADADGTVFLIDMDTRELVLTSEGRIKKDVTSAFADSIMDNVYLYASNGKYEMSCKKTFEQVHRLLLGKRIAQPMKYICNIFLAIILSIILNYAFIKLYTRKKKVKHPEFMLHTEEKFLMNNLTPVEKRAYEKGHSSYGRRSVFHTGSRHHSSGHHSSGRSHSYHSSGRSSFSGGSHRSHHSSGSHRF